MQCDSVTKIKVTLRLLPFAQGLQPTSAMFFLYYQECIKCANNCLQHILTLEALKYFVTLRVCSYSLLVLTV